VNKRTFLGLLPGVVAGCAKPAAHQEKAEERLTNWAGNLTYGTRDLRQVSTVEEIRAALRTSDQVRVLGSRHCFNAIADTSKTQLRLRADPAEIRIDPAARRATVGASLTYGQLCPALHAAGWALHNLASLPHISVAGACCTGTHGSGEKNRNLAASIEGIEMVSASGEELKLSRAKSGEPFEGMVVSLGALGVIRRLTLALEPAFEMRQHVYLDMPMAAVRDRFNHIQASGYSVSLFTDWQAGRVNEVWVKSRAEDRFAAPPEWLGARRATRNLHPIASLPAENCTEQMGVPGPWHERLPHFRMGFMPSAGRELQAEYFVPRKHGVEAILAIERLRDQIGPHLLISEIRTVASDDLWLSPCYEQDSVAIHFTWKPDGPAVQRLLPLIEKELGPFQPRPHWGKLFAMDGRTLRSRYERIEDFQTLARRMDPGGKFRNEFVERFVFG
jgi:xylitol oxidase